jgi:hypothetical protein
MIALLAAKAMLRDTNAVLGEFAQNAKRITPEEFREAEIAIAECRNLLNCIEEKLSHVRP